jgi:hypothetical protein
VITTVKNTGGFGSLAVSDQLEAVSWVSYPLCESGWENQYRSGSFRLERLVYPELETRVAALEFELIIKFHRCFSYQIRETGPGLVTRPVSPFKRYYLVVPRGCLVK